MNPENDFSEAVEDYLKAIFDLEQGGKNITTNQIAAQLAVKPASVTSMLKKLAAFDPPLVDYHKHRGVRLTEAGKKAALRTVRQHRLIEQFLVQVMGYSWDEVHEEADHMEHAISPKFEERMATILGEPSYDPHGDPIPGPDLSLPSNITIPLAQLPAGQTATVRRVLSSDSALLRYLGTLGIHPDARLTLLAQVPYDHTLRVRVAGQDQEQVLGAELGARILVESPAA
ncbi:MAG: metal-dependent transcriptional regulator [Chloroflexi bacterium]|nr:metal-dependent transcriptional regulator [Chloroflexota bacterium]